MSGGRPGTMPARARRAALLVAALLVAALALGARLAAAQEPAAGSRASSASGRCATCHPAERVAFEKSPHAREGVRCVSCHGGDDTSLDQATAHSRGFTGKPARQSIPRLCASCHSDEDRMRPYDLPVDQLALYQTSGHGRQLAAGNLKVAVCSDCHGAHDVLAADDPASRVYVTNVPRTCGACHGDSTRVGRKDTVYQDYLSSVHARELLDRGNLRAPTCVSCHGVHGAAPPQVGDVTKVCGRCHTAEERYFIAGPHQAAMARQQLPQCVSCHGNHAVPAAVVDRLGSSCASCHDASDPQIGLGGRLLADYRGADSAIRAAEAVVARAEAVPIQTDDYHARIEEARTYLREALISAHAVQPQVMESFSLRAQSIGSEIESEVHDKLGQLRTNRLLLILFWFYVIVTIGILRRLRDRQPQER